MTDKHKQFLAEYIKDFNATRAYLAVYPGCGSENSAITSAVRLLKRADVRRYVDEKLASIESEAIAESETVLAFLTSLIRTYEVDGKADFKMKGMSVPNAIKVCELLGKHHGMFLENDSVSSLVSINFIEGGFKD